MKIYLRNDETGGWSNESCALIGYNRHLIGAGAKIASMKAKPLLNYIYDSKNILPGELKNENKQN